jgi:hypothetical protein
MWVLFIGWVFTRRQIRKTDMFSFGRRLAYVAVACTFATGLIGTGMLTSVPSTAVVLLLTGWIVVPEVRFAPSAASFRLKAEATPSSRETPATPHPVASAFRRKFDHLAANDGRTS